MNLYARTYQPNEVVVNYGEPVPGVMFVVEGILAVCEPDGDPFCIIGEASYVGDFQVI